MKRRLLVVAEAILGARPFVAGPRFMLSSLACWYCWSNPTLACLSTVRLSVTPRELPAGARRSGCAPGRSIVLGKARWVSHQLPAISRWLSAVGCMVLFGSISMLGRRVVRTPRYRHPATHARVLYPSTSATTKIFATAKIKNFWRWSHGSTLAGIPYGGAGGARRWRYNLVFKIPS